MTCVKARTPLLALSSASSLLRLRPRPASEPSTAPRATPRRPRSSPAQILGFIMAQKPADRVRWPCFDLVGPGAGLALSLPAEKVSAYTAFMWVRLEELPPVPPKQRNVVPLFFAYGMRDRFLGGVRAMVGVTNATGLDGRPAALFDVCVQAVASDMSGQSAPPMARALPPPLPRRAPLRPTHISRGSKQGLTCGLRCPLPVSAAEPSAGPDWALPVVFRRRLSLQVAAVGLRLGERPDSLPVPLTKRNAQPPARRQWKPRPSRLACRISRARGCAHRFSSTGRSSTLAPCPTQLRLPRGPRSRCSWASALASLRGTPAFAATAFCMRLRGVDGRLEREPAAPVRVLPRPQMHLGCFGLKGSPIAQNVIPLRVSASCLCGMRFYLSRAAGAVARDRGYTT